MKGNKIYSKTSWGCHEARLELGVVISKTKESSTEVALAYWHSQAVFCEHIGVAIDELLQYVLTLNPTHNGDEVRQTLRDQWEKWRPQFSDDMEKVAYKNVLTSVGLFFQDAGGIGRKQLKDKILLEVCNNMSIYFS